MWIRQANGLLNIFILSIFNGFLSIGLNAAVKIKTERVSIQTSVTNGPCKNEIEAALITTKGVECAEINTETKKINVKYDPSQVSPEQIGYIISRASCE